MPDLIAMDLFGPGHLTGMKPQRSTKPEAVFRHMDRIIGGAFAQVQGVIRSQTDAAMSGALCRREFWELGKYFGLDRHWVISHFYTNADF
jgi:hypothetical protein